MKSSILSRADIYNKARLQGYVVNVWKTVQNIVHTFKPMVNYSVGIASFVSWPVYDIGSILSWAFLMLAWKFCLGY